MTLYLLSTPGCVSSTNILLHHLSAVMDLGELNVDPAL